MKAIDTNILVYWQVSTSPEHTVAARLVTSLAEGRIPWAIPWPCVYEFLRVVTHPKVFQPPVPVELALRNLRKLFQSPVLHLLGETSAHWELALTCLKSSRVSGNIVHDGHIAALCIEHGVEELYTRDADFGRFAGLKATNPFG